MAIVFIFISVFFNVATQLLVKQGMLEVGQSPTQAAGMLGFLIKAMTNFKVIGGFFCALMTTGSWMVALSRTNLSFAYPFMGLVIVLVLALSPVLFKEQVAPNQWIGVGLVCVGIWVASRK